jgi:hypothetical protein
MTTTDYVATLEQLLRLSHVPFEQRVLLDFTHDCWPLILDDPNAARWATAFLDSRLAGVTERKTEEAKVLSRNADYVAQPRRNSCRCPLPFLLPCIR